jgi:hypothetical protein
MARASIHLTPEVCPACGANVPRGAKACPGCGSDEQTGWSEEALASGLDLPDEEFDYDDFTKREFGGATAKPRGISWLWWVVAVVILIVAVWGWVIK